MRYSKEMFFWAFSMSEKKKNIKEHKKWKAKTAQKDSVLFFGGGGGLGKQRILPNGFFKTDCKTRFMLGRGKAKGIFVKRMRFGKIILFLSSRKPDNTTEIGASAGTWPNRKSFSFKKGIFGRGLWKAVYSL